jgi:hypothetical protein
VPRNARALAARPPSSLWQLIPRSRIMTGPAVIG